MRGLVFMTTVTSLNTRIDASFALEDKPAAT
jgi:hypothetical protein